MSKTINETVAELHGALVEYIEATYHIGHPGLIEQRKEILKEKGVIHQEPYIESTPRYRSGNNFRGIPGLPKPVVLLFEKLTKPLQGKNILFDPPYEHQAEAVEKILVAKKNIVIMTGTGSGKTESFLLPFLGKLAVEAHSKPKQFKDYDGMRGMILYPMNALVNDQLGRLRSFFGHPEFQKLFLEWSGRIPRFSRYTSRTPYAGLRTSKKDGQHLLPFRDFYVRQLQSARENSDAGRFSKKLIAQLEDKGKWPAKPDIEGWYGKDGTDWINRKTHTYERAVTLPGDAELLTRHEVQETVPDLLVTNYSMLEYMMMRPIERPIFERTRKWLDEFPDEKFLIILDEAHLYRGAAGAEVGHLLRRLRDRLGVSEDRMQVICSTASFRDPKNAVSFASQLAGVSQSSFSNAITGTLARHASADKGLADDAKILAAIDLTNFYEENIDVKKASVSEFLSFRNVEPSGSIEVDLYNAFRNYAPFLELVNITMAKAQPTAAIGEKIFPSVDLALATQATSNMASIGSAAREFAGASNLLSCRVHSFHRGLRGLWICMDACCSKKPLRSTDVTGKMFSEPIEECECGSRVLELFTCRNCGTAYARGYVDSVSNPTHVWPLPGARLVTRGTQRTPLKPIDILLEKPPSGAAVEIFDFDLETGQLNPDVLGPRTRKVYLKAGRNTPHQQDADDTENEDLVESGELGTFQPCGVCLKDGYQGRGPVQDHETKGDQPFQVLLSKQLSTQPPGIQPATAFAPLRGRKVLAFSDSRQVAARLAPNLQMFASRDTLRALIVAGFKHIQALEDEDFESKLDDLYAAVMLAAAESDIRLRPERKPSESFEFERVRAAVRNGVLKDPKKLMHLVTDLRTHKPPEALYSDIYLSMRDRARGLEALALGSIVERPEKRPLIYELPEIPGVATTGSEKISLVRAWLRCWHFSGFHLRVSTPDSWYEGNVGQRTVKSNKGVFKKVMDALIPKPQRTIFTKKWLPLLLQYFTEEKGPGKYRLRGSDLTLEFGGEWVRCKLCKSVHRPLPTSNICQDCKRPTVEPLDPNLDEVFIARKGFYRNYALSVSNAPFALIAAEHTAQLNSPQVQDVFSKAEQNELLFQDVEIPSESSVMPFSAVDVLSSTTTMEVGIDIGQLSGVALRNMPPTRANYQQRAGRAGRRGTSIATVVGFGGSDTHDEFYFSNPEAMISGDVVDPTLSLNKKEIARRHIRAFLLQNYHLTRITADDQQSNGDLFSVLGNVTDFKQNGVLNIRDFESWLQENVAPLKERINDWLPSQLSAEDRLELLSQFIEDAVGSIEQAVNQYVADAEKPSAKPTQKITEGDADTSEVQSEVGEEVPVEGRDKSKLLDWLLYKAILPRYAFPTDVATFYVFDYEKSTAYRSVPRFAPGQGLPVALSQYAPGKQVWIAGKCYTSGALFSPMRQNLGGAWANKKIYLECNTCGFSSTEPAGQGFEVGTHIDCIACGSIGSVGPLRNWLRPPGFAHPIMEPELTSPDEIPETSYATRAQLTMASPTQEVWTEIGPRIRYIATQATLLVSNSGPEKQGYIYCVGCGRIEAETSHDKKLGRPHIKPYKDKVQECTVFATHNLVLGTDFVTDIALFSLRVEDPIQLLPTNSVTHVALRTVSEALTRAATGLLQIEPGEIMAEFRPALTIDGIRGLEAQIFLYDTLPGGAGFSQNAANLGMKLFSEALRIMETCPKNCDGSCYSCLRTFRNRIDHGLIDRHVGASLLQYLVHDNAKSYSPMRIRSSENLLHAALSRISIADTTIAHDVILESSIGERVVVPIVLTKTNGNRLFISLSDPLSEGVPTGPAAVPSIKAHDRWKTINELVVRKNIPSATDEILTTLREI